MFLLGAIKIDWKETCRSSNNFEHDIAIIIGFNYSEKKKILFCSVT